MPSTTRYTIPYPSLADSPNGPVQMQNLAERVEAVLGPVDDTAANANTTANAALVAANLLGGKKYTTAGTLVTASTTTEVLANTNTGALNFLAGVVYSIRFAFSYTQGNGSDLFAFRVRDTTVSGAVMISHCPPPQTASAVPLVCELEFLYAPTVNTTKTFVSTIQRVTGSNSLSITASDSTYAIAEKMGTAVNLTLV